MRYKTSFSISPTLKFEKVVTRGPSNLEKVVDPGVLFSWES